MNEIAEWRSKLLAFRDDVSGLLANSDEAVASRAYNAHDALERVSKLSFEQADSLKQAVRSVEAGLNKAAFVLSWIALADLMLEVAVAKIAEVKLARPKWKYTDKTSLAEDHGDYAIAQALKEAGVISKSEMKTLHGLLHRRNQCAHRSDVFPTANEALGFVDEALPSARALLAKLEN